MDGWVDARLPVKTAGPVSIMKKSSLGKRKREEEDSDSEAEDLAPPAPARADQQPATEVAAAAPSAKAASQYAAMARELFTMCKNAKLSMDYLFITHKLTPAAAAGWGIPPHLRAVLPSAQPRYLTGGTLKQHQMTGLRWLCGMHWSGFNGIVADDMGLGKTITTAAYLAQLLQWAVEDYAAAAAEAEAEASDATHVDVMHRLLHMSEAEYYAATAAPGTSTGGGAAAAAAAKATTNAALLPANNREAHLKKLAGSSTVSAAWNALLTDDGSAHAAAAAHGKTAPAPGLAALLQPLPADATPAQRQAAAATLAAAAAGGPITTTNSKGAGAGAGAGNALRLVERMRLVSASISAAMPPADAGTADAGTAAEEFQPPLHALPSMLDSLVVQSKETGGFSPFTLSRGSLGPHLIVCPASTLANWQRELAKWCPLLKVVLFAGSKADRDAAVWDLDDCNVVLTSYAALERGDALRHLKHRDWQVCVLDEAHGVKNSASARFANLVALRARQRLLLTGTPVQNNVAELVSLLRFIVADVFVRTDASGRYQDDEEAGWDDEGSGAGGRGGGGGGGKGRGKLSGAAANQDALVQAFQNEIAALVKQKKKAAKAAAAAAKKSSSKGAGAGGIGGEEESEGEMASALSDILSAFILRRTKQSVDLSLPPKMRVTQWAPQTASQARLTATLHAVLLSLAAPQSVVATAIRAAIQGIAGDEQEHSNSSSPASASASATSRSPASGRSGCAASSRNSSGAASSGGAGGKGMLCDTTDLFGDISMISAGGSARGADATVELDEDLEVTVATIGVNGSFTATSGANADRSLLFPLALPPMQLQQQQRQNSAAGTHVTLVPALCDVFTDASTDVITSSNSSSSSSAYGSSSSSGSSSGNVMLTSGNGALASNAAVDAAAASSGAIGRLLMLLRKAALHPLLLRSRYSNATCLALARLLHALDAEAEAREAGRANKKRIVDNATGRKAVPATTATTSSSSSSSSVLYDTASPLEQLTTLVQLPPDGHGLSPSALSHLAALHARPNKLELQLWSGGDKGLADIAELLLDCSDFDVHRAALGYGDDPRMAPFLLPDAAFTDAGKIAWLQSQLSRAAECGDKVLIFSQFTAMLDLLEVVLNQWRYGYRRLDGSTPVAQRQVLIDEFSAAPPEDIRVMLLSTRAGGVGLNLTAASTVIIYDCDWNPLNDAQAEDRAHRMGQTKPVTVYRLLTERTVECHMSSTADRKHDMATTLMALSERAAVPDAAAVAKRLQRTG